MSGSFAERVYGSLPVALQNVACSWYGYREGKIRRGPIFDARLQSLSDSDRWSYSEYLGYQDEQLRALVQHAFANVPYYRSIMEARRLRPEDIRGVADLPKLPVLTKEDVRLNFDRLLARNANRGCLIWRHTSGTTGKALSFYSTKASLAFQWAVWWRHRMRLGLRLRDWHANFTGHRVVPGQQQEPPFWRWNYPTRQALVGMQQIVPEKVSALVRFLSEHEFSYYSGYPSIIHSFVLIASEAGLKLARPPRVIDTGAENILQTQRRDIEAFTGAVLTDQYGMSEGAGNASQCEHGSYHEDHEFGVLEAVEEESTGDGRARGRILCTGFACPEFPFLRYEIGDVGVWQPRSFRCRCGRESRVLHSIEGRVDDYVITPEGRRVMRFDYVFKDAKEVKECQVVQRERGAIVLRVVRRNGYAARDEQMIASEISRWISPTLKISFEYVPVIERSSSGKFKAVVSELERSATCAP